MGLAVAILMDPVESIDIEADSTFVLALEAQRRGYGLFHFLPQDLFMRDGRVFARARPFKVRRVKGDHATLGTCETIDLETMDIVLMRQDPPFDMAYITATHMLDHLQPETLVVNDPVHVRNAPEKLFVTRFADLMPPTLITANRGEIERFRAEYGDIVLKPLYGNGGAGVFHVAPGNDNLGALLEMFTELYREPVIVQRYIAEVREGDTRIILIDGEPAGAVRRIPREGEARANFHAGARAEKATLSRRDRQICEMIGPALRERGLLFAGIDVIGDYLTEINVTSPTGLQEIDRLDKVCLESDLWDAIERRFASRHQTLPT